MILHVDLRTVQTATYWMSLLPYDNDRQEGHQTKHRKEGPALPELLLDFTAGWIFQQQTQPMARPYRSLAGILLPRPIL
jgi:hypothetical protein